MNTVEKLKELKDYRAPFAWLRSTIEWELSTTCALCNVRKCWKPHTGSAMENVYVLPVFPLWFFGMIYHRLMSTPFKEQLLCVLFHLVVWIELQNEFHWIQREIWFLLGCTIRSEGCSTLRSLIQVDSTLSTTGSYACFILVFTLPSKLERSSLRTRFGSCPPTTDRASPCPWLR